MIPIWPETRFGIRQFIDMNGAPYWHGKYCTRVRKKYRGQYYLTVVLSQCTANTMDEVCLEITRMFNREIHNFRLFGKIDLTATYVGTREPLHVLDPDQRDDKEIAMANQPRSRHGN